MKKRTARNISKGVQLKHTKEKLYEMKHDKSDKKINLVKSLKNLMKRNNRKGMCKTLSRFSFCFIKLLIFRLLTIDDMSSFSKLGILHGIYIWSI